MTSTLLSTLPPEEAEQKPHYLGHRQRLRERMLTSRKGTLPDYEILEVLLFSASPRGDVKPLAKALIERFDNFSGVLHASETELLKVKGLNLAAIAQFRVVLEAVERLAREQVINKPILQSWKALLDYCRSSMGHLKKEQFRMLYLDKKNYVIADELQETGTVDKTPVYPREIVKRALELEASSLIMVHNHPSGDTTPSQADIAITKQVQMAAEALGVKLHDHVIISRTSHFSFKSYGII